MPDFTAPKTAPAADERRAQLVAEKGRIQTALADPNRLHNGRRMTDREYHTWRAGVVQRLHELDAELVFLKAFKARLAQAEDEEKQKWSVITDGRKRLEALNAAIGSLMDYMFFLERDNAELRAEAEALRQQLGSQSDDTIRF
jgi:hypothetical protein